MSIKIAFLGIESYDIIHYFSRLLKNLEYSVLVIDESKESEILTSVPIPKGEDFELCLCTINYREIDFTKYWKKNEVSKYDYVLTCFGTNLNEELLQKHDYLFYVTDLQIQNIKRIQYTRKKLIDKSPQQYLVIRDFLGVKKKRFIERECKFNESHYLSEDITDRKLMLECQYNTVFTFRKASPDLKELLIDMYELDKEIDKKFRKAFKRAERGK